jgi:hypothetical protein
MEKVKRAGKAIVVIFIVGLGFIHNLDKKSFLYESFNPVSISWDKPTVRTDSATTNDSNLYLYTKKIIDSGIHQLISKL